MRTSPRRSVGEITAKGGSGVVVGMAAEDAEVTNVEAADMPGLECERRPRATEAARRRIATKMS